MEGADQASAPLLTELMDRQNPGGGYQVRMLDDF
jgi:hypothetical protein